MARRRAGKVTLDEAEAARSANEDLFERMGAYAIEITGSGGDHALVVHFASDPLPRMPATVKARGRAGAREEDAGLAQSVQSSTTFPH